MPRRLDILLVAGGCGDIGFMPTTSVVSGEEANESRALLQHCSILFYYKMPNQYQWAFLAAFFTTLTFLIFMASLISQFFNNNDNMGSLDFLALVSNPTFIISASVVFVTAVLSKLFLTGTLAPPVLNLISSYSLRSYQTIGSNRLERVSTRKENSGFTQHRHVRVLPFLFASPHFILF